MAARSRMVINREALHEVDLAMADAMEAMAVDVVGRVRPPDAAPFGEGLVESGGYVTYVDGRKVGGGATKPRSMRVRGRGVVTATGYGFPGYFQEVGTVNQPPRPFLAPVVMDVMGDRGAVEGAMRAAFSRRRSLARPR